MQGFPTAVIDEEALQRAVGDQVVLDHLYAELAGNMFSATVGLTLKLAIFSTIPLPEDDIESDTSSELDTEGCLGEAAALVSGL